MDAILTWLPKVFFGVIFITTVFLYYFSALKEKLLVIISIGFYVFYAAILTISQYYIWSQNKLTQVLLNLSVDFSAIPISGIFKFFCKFVDCQKHGYFLFYTYGRFWMNIFISIAVAFGFYLFLKFLKKYKERFFEEGEIELGFLAALISGWPNFVVFLPIVFVSVVLISIFRRIFWKEFYTTLGWPFILSTLLVLIFGNKLIDIFSLGVLRI